MALIIILLIVCAVGYFWLKGDPKWIKELYKGKSDEQKKVIRYFYREGCLSSTISDSEYDAMVAQKVESLNSKQKALDKQGIDITQVNEIEPVTFEGYVYDSKIPAKRGADGQWRSAQYQVSWLFFSDTQVYFYQYTFRMDEITKKETTDEYFYKDIVNFSSASETYEVNLYDKNGNKSVGSVDSNVFRLIVPGDKISCALEMNDTSERAIQGMKSKLREKKGS